MKKLGIIGAMAVEVETLKEHMQEKTVAVIAGMEFCQGILEGMPSVVVQCGVGKVNAAMCAQILCAVYGVSHLVNTGIAGSLDNELDVGDLLISRDAMYHDFDCCAFGYPQGRVPGLTETAFPADEALAALAAAAAERVHPGHCRLGRVATGDQFVCTRQQKDRIIAVTGAQCTEMEGGAIAQTAFRNGVPFVIIRAISDKADESVEVDYPTFETLSAHRCAQVTLELARQLRD